MRLLVQAACVLLAACGSGSEPSQPADDATPIPVEPDGGIGDGAGPPDAATTADSIPVALRGVWGLSADDCTAERGATTGLLTVSDDELTFFESAGELRSVAERGADSVRATFDFSGEGMTWTREMRLETESDGETLVRRDIDADAAPDPIRYTRCK